MKPLWTAIYNFRDRDFHVTSLHVTMSSAKTVSRWKLALTASFSSTNLHFRVNPKIESRSLPLSKHRSECDSSSTLKRYFEHSIFHFFFFFFFINVGEKDWNRIFCFSILTSSIRNIDSSSTLKHYFEHLFSFWFFTNRRKRLKQNLLLFYSNLFYSKSSILFRLWNAISSVYLSFFVFF